MEEITIETIDDTEWGPALVERLREITVDWSDEDLAETILDELERRALFYNLITHIMKDVENAHRALRI